MRRVQVRDGFVLLVAALYFLGGGRVLFALALAALAHETGHVLALYLLGGRVRRLVLSGSGAALCCALPEGRLACAAICLAGPVAGLIVAFCAHQVGKTLLCGANVLLSAFNLVPLPPLDGGMLLWHLFAGGGRALRVAVGAAACAALIVCGAAVFFRGGGAWLWILSAAAPVQAAKACILCHRGI